MMHSGEVQWLPPHQLTLTPFVFPLSGLRKFGVIRRNKAHDVKGSGQGAEAKFLLDICYFLLINSEFNIYLSKDRSYAKR